MANLSDILTTAQNIPTAINALATTYLKVQGNQNAADISTTTLVSSSPGRVATVVVSTAGSAVGHIYDQSATTPTARVLFVIPMTVGINVVNMPASYGILVVPGSGQVVTVSYS